METMEVTRVTIDEIKARMDRGEEFTFVDARNPEAWAAAETKLPGAIRVPANEVEQHLSEISHERTVITYCTCPHEASSAEVAQKLAGREKEIGDGMAQIYAAEFTEQELKDLVTFYKSPLGAKLIAAEPRAVQNSMGFMQKWAHGFAEVINGQFRAEMKKRGKEI